MRYKICYSPYFYVEAKDVDEAAKKAIEHKVNIQGAVREPAGILSTASPNMQRIEVFIYDIREEPEDGGQSESEGDAEGEVTETL